MRFLLKIAFLLGLVALFLPYGREDGEIATPGLSPIVLLYGAQQAIHDLGGFCERAPAACATGRDAIRFAGERIGDGLALAYALANERLNAPADAERAPPSPRPPHAAPPARDAVGSVERTPRPVPVNTQAPPPRPYSPPVSERAALPPDGSPSGGDSASASPAAVPPSRTASAAESGASPPFRMPALAIGGDEPLRSMPEGLVPPFRAPLPQPAPRA